MTIETHRKRKPEQPSRMTPRKIHMVTQKETNSFAPTITIATHNMATQIEYRPLPWYNSNVVIDSDTAGLL